MTSRLACALAVPVLLGLASPAAAQEVAPDILRTQLGDWLVVPDTGRPGCRIRLEPGRTIGGMVARPAADCAARLPRLAEVAAWSFAGGVRLSDATRKTVLTFGEDETTMLKTPADERPQYFMVRAKPGVDSAPHAPAIFGAWVLQRPTGPALCRVTFSDKPPAGGEESYGLSLDPACDPAVKRLKLASWRIEDVSLMLYGLDGASIRFESAPDGFDKAASEGGRPLRLVRVR